MLVIDTEFRDLVTEFAYFGGIGSELHLLNDRGAVLAQATPSVRADTVLTIRARFAELEWIELLYGDQSATIVKEPRTERQLALGLRKVLFDAESSQRFITVIFTKERSAVVSAATASGSQSLIAALIVTAIALVFGWWFGRGLDAPLRHIAHASTVYGIAGERLDLPVRARDEIGVLARSMNTMIEQVEERTGQLENEVRERERAEASLRSSETRHRTVHDTIVDALITIDASGIIQSFNPAAESIFGYDASVIISENIKTLMPDDFRSRYEAGLKRHQETSEARVIGQEVEVEGLHKSGRVFPLELSVSEMDIDGQTQYCGLVRDITERKRQERRLEEQKADLERSNAELAQFAYVASHDLQEPLRTVTSFVQLLERRYGEQLGDDADRYIRHAVQGCGRMKHLIEDLLRFSRVGSEGEKLSPTDAGVALQQALADLAAAIDECGARVTQDELPVVLADQNQLRTLLLNLIGNALKYRGARMPLIDVTVRRVNTAWEFSVKDNGIGIERQYRERVFGVFQRLHGRSEYEGSGIGLAVCKKIVERHSGRIWLDSEPDEGTTVFFTLKAAAAFAAQPTEPKAA